MKKIIILISMIATFGLLQAAQATSGACSSHGGANCGIGPINNQAVCNDGWLSSVSYYSMDECIGYDSSCASYLNEEQYFLTKSTIKKEQTTLQTEIDTLKLELNSLDYKKVRALVDLQESFRGRGVTAEGIQPFINAIHRDYTLKRVDMSHRIDVATNQYNNKVKEYNGICRNYTYEEKNNICVQNLGSQSKYDGTVCTCNYGYVLSGLTCIKNPCPAYASLNGNVCTCNTGYVLSGSNCITYTSNCKNKYGVYSYANDGNVCICNDGYILSGSNCIPYTLNCKNKHGAYSYANGQDCACQTDYEWNSEKTTCIKPTPILNTNPTPTPTITPPPSPVTQQTPQPIQPSPQIVNQPSSPFSKPSTLKFTSKETKPIITTSSVIKSIKALSTPETTLDKAGNIEGQKTEPIVENQPKMESVQKTDDSKNTIGESSNKVGFPQKVGKKIDGIVRGAGGLFKKIFTKIKFW